MNKLENRKALRNIISGLPRNMGFGIQSLAIVLDIRVLHLMFDGTRSGLLDHYAVPLPRIAW